MVSQASSSNPTNNKADEENEFLKYSGSSNHINKSMLISTLVKITLPFIILVHIYLIFKNSTYPTQFFRKTCAPKETTNDSTPNIIEITPYPYNDENILEGVLKNASMEDNKTVIITILNGAWMKPNSLFDLFLESFKIGYKTQNLLKHLVVVAFDEDAHSHCIALNLHCYRIITKGVDFSGEVHYMSNDYLRMMWSRTDFLRSVLELGYNFVFTDADIMWLRDPFQRFYPDGDIQIACDQYRFPFTNPDYLDNSPNGGFKYVKANNRTIQFYKFWNMGKHYFPGKNEQDVLNLIKKSPFVTEEIGLKMRFLDTAYFGGFCEPSKDLDLVITMHANCCIGMKAKIHDIRMLIHDWKNYKGLPVEERNISTRSWTVPRLCG